MNDPKWVDNLPFDYPAKEYVVELFSSLRAAGIIPTINLQPGVLYLAWEQYTYTVSAVVRNKNAVITYTTNSKYLIA